MGKRTRSQRRGKRKAPSHRYKDKIYERSKIEGKIINILNDPGRTAPVAKVKFDDGDEKFIIAPEGLEIGQRIKCGITAEIKPGNRLRLAEIPEGVPIHNIESYPGSKGKFSRSSGVYSAIVSHDIGKTVIILSSGKRKEVDPRCKASIGVVSGRGRTDKPFLKAGKKWYARRARGKAYPVTSGVSMNAVDHPFGGSTKPGTPKTVSRHAPPGAKVGSFGAKRTGKNR